MPHGNRIEGKRMREEGFAMDTRMYDMVPGTRLALDGMVRHMVEKAGKTGSDICRSMNRSPNYLSVMLSKGSTPGLDTFLGIAEAACYQVRMECVETGERWLLAMDDGKPAFEWLGRAEGAAKGPDAAQKRREAIDALIEALSLMRDCER